MRTIFDSKQKQQKLNSHKKLPEYQVGKLNRNQNDQLYYELNELQELKRN